MENELAASGLPPKKDKPKCTNCGKKMLKKASFCPHCGQKRQKRRVTMRDLLQKLWDTTFHLENKFFRMFQQVFIPGKVTAEYFQGRVQRYPHPVKFFLVCMFFFVLAVSTGNQIKVSASGAQGGASSNLFGIFDQENVAAAKGKLEFYEAVVREWEALPAEKRSPSSRGALDSLLALPAKPFLYLRTDSFDFAFSAFLFSRPYKMAYHDLLELEVDSLFQRYGVSNTWDRLLLRKSIKASNDPKAVGQFWLGTLTWTLLLLVAVMAVWLYVFYRRQGRYYVEHFVWQLHLQSGMVLIFTAGVLLGRLLHWPFVFYGLPLLWCWAASLVALRRFYGQEWGPTIFKWFLYWVLCFVSLPLLFFSSILVSVLVF